MSLLLRCFFLFPVHRSNEQFTRNAVITFKLTSNNMESFYKFREQFETFLSTSLRVPTSVFATAFDLPELDYLCGLLETASVSVMISESLHEATENWLFKLVVSSVQDTIKTPNLTVGQLIKLAMEKFHSLPLSSSMNNLQLPPLLERSFRIIFTNFHLVSMCSIDSLQENDLNKTVNVGLRVLESMLKPLKLNEKIDFMLQWKQCNTHLENFMRDNSRLLQQNYKELKLAFRKLLLDENLNVLQFFLDQGINMDNVCDESFVKSLYREISFDCYEYFDETAINNSNDVASRNRRQKYASVNFPVNLSRGSGNSFIFLHISLLAILVNKPKVFSFYSVKSQFKVMAFLLYSQLWRIQSEWVAKFDLNRTSFQSLSSHCLNTAVEVLKECETLHLGLTKRLLLLEIPEFNGKSIFEVAAFSGFKEVLDLRSSKLILRQLWYNGLHLDARSFANYLILPFRLCDDLSTDNDVKNQTFDNKKGYKSHKLRLFYLSPAFKFFLHSSSYLFFALLFSLFYIDLRNGHPSGEEVYCYITSCCYLVQLYLPWIKLKEPFRLKVKLWLQNEFNIIETVQIVATTLAFSIRILGFRSDFSFMLAKSFYGLSVLTVLLKLVRFFQCSSRLGPIWIFIRKMLKQTLIFFCIFLVLVCGFGLCLHLSSLRTCEFVSQDEEIKVGSYEGGQWVFLKAYFMFFGEKFYNSISLACNSDPKRYMSEIMLSLMLFAGNALVLNVLIALYRSVFLKVQQRSSLEWTSEMYWLVREFTHNTFCPPPFSMIELVVVFFVKKVT